MFLENFEQRFRKEIKISKLNPYPIFTMTKELEISKTQIFFLIKPKNFHLIKLKNKKRLECNRKRTWRSGNNPLYN